MSSAWLQAALFLAPALALWALLSLGRYPGERVLARLAPRRARSRATATKVSRRARTPRAGRARNLLACSLAGRAPPSRRTPASEPTT
jgi:hypothetical protein